MKVFLTAEFKNGMPNGKWTHTSSSNNIPWINFEVNFNEGLPVGVFKFENKKTNELVSGILSPKGYMQGEWKLVQEGYEYIQVYQNNNYALVIQREVSSGKVLGRIDHKANAQKSSSGEPIADSTNYDPLDNEDIFGYHFLKHIWSG
jgi:hypothetical protein